MPMSPRLLRPKASGFNPKSLGTLALWLDGADRSRMFSDDAATTLSADDGQVAVYKDKANGYNLSQTTANNRPLVRSAFLNGKSVLEFDGSNDSLATPALADNWAAVTAFCVLNTEAAGFVSRLFDRSPSGTVGINWFRGASVLTMQIGPGGVGHSSAAGSITNGNWFFATANWNGGTVALTSITQRVNGVAGGSGSGTATLQSTASVQAFIGNRAQNDRTLDGYIGEMLIYSQSLSAAAVLKVEGYLKTKWGL